MLKFSHGSYAYLLILQILVITGLLLSLIWLIIKRTRESEFLTQMAGAGVDPFDEGASANQTPQEVSPTQFAEFGQKLTDAMAQNSALAEETKTFKDKVAFLESKLVEYEILQEEISTIGNLKKENETLKTDLVKLQNQLREIEKGQAAPVESPEKMASAVAEMSAFKDSAARAALEELMNKIEDITPDTKPSPVTAPPAS